MIARHDDCAKILSATILMKAGGVAVSCNSMKPCFPMSSKEM